MKKRKFKIKNLLLCVFMIYVCITLANQQLTISKLRKAEQAAQAKIQKVAVENERVKTMINNASTDEAIEKMAREQLGLVKPGEKVYIDQSASDSNSQKGGN